MTRPLRALAGGAACAATLLLSRGHADACYNTVMSHVDPTVAYLGEAERLADGGNPKEAIAWVKSARADFVRAEVGKSGISDRALGVLAIAVVRSGGEARVKAGEGSELPWAKDTLKRLWDASPGEPARTTHLAEVLARDPETQADALGMLAKLERGDLVTSPWGYATLARLRGEATKGRPPFVAAPLASLAAGRVKLELRRCEAMSRDSGLCKSGIPDSPRKPDLQIKARVAAENARIDDINAMVTGSYRRRGR